MAQPTYPTLFDAPLYVVLNVGAGRSDDENPAEVISQVLTEAGRAHEILLVEAADDLAAIARRAVEKACSARGIVVAAGGDGTLNAVAGATLGTGCGFGVIPQGTFNYFGRSHGIPEGTAEAAAALLSARIEPVQVGLVNGQVFLVNASLGLYPLSLEIREQQKQLHGRTRLVAMWAALLAVLRDYRPLSVRLEFDGKVQDRRTLTLFVGNNALQLEQIGLEPAIVDQHGKLAAVVLKPVSRIALLRLMLLAAMGRLQQETQVETIAVKSLSVTPLSKRLRRLKVATDGETGWMETPIEFRVSPEPLWLLKPAAGEKP